MAASYAIISSRDDFRVDLINDVAKVSALAAWRVTQSIYCFDPDLYPRLIATPVNKLPIDVLYRLPEWCVYIETPDLQWYGFNLVGFFAHLEYDVNDGQHELRLLLDVDEGEHGSHLYSQILHLMVDTLEEAIAVTMEEARKNIMDIGNTHILNQLPDEELVKSVAEALEPILSLLLYLCSESADFGDREPPTNPQPTKTKKGWKLFPPNQPTTWNVGVRIGAALRQAYLLAVTGQASEKGDTGRAKPRAHVRRAHWHSYWTGPLNGDRKAIVKWIPPVPVNVENLDDMPSTVKMVSSQ
jgi:hypothetical protein